MAFEDTWQWSQELYEGFMGDRRNSRLLDLVESLHRILGRSEMMAYVLMMAPRLLELHRALKPTGSLYLHCDPVASHYLKIILDVVFGPDKFRNEITWKRTSSHNDAKQGRKIHGSIHDTILFYSKTDEWTWNWIYTPYDDGYINQNYKYIDPKTGRRYRLDNLTAAKPGGDVSYEFHGTRPYKGRYWAYSKDNLEKFYREGRLYFPKNGGTPSYIRYLDEMPGVPIQNLWTDIPPIQSNSKERRGYPTQKPLALLERIIAASSNEGDVVLDPFCGCGTAVIQAERMNRKWIGIDVTWLAIAEIIYRLNSETSAKRDETYRVEGDPKDQLAAREFFRSTERQNHKPFEMWAVSLVEGEPQEKKGGDQGVDGRIPLYDIQNRLRWAVIQVKGGHLTPSLVRDFARVIERDNAPFGIFISLQEPSKQMRQEAEGLGFVEGFGSRRIPRMQLLTIREILEEGKRPELPLGYMVQRHDGVGRVQARNEEMNFE